MGRHSLEVTNEGRAHAALQSLVPYARSVYYDSCGEDLTTTMGDFLGDAMHLAAQLGLDPRKALKEAAHAADFHYHAEAEDEAGAKIGYEALPYTAEEWLRAQPRHYVVSGRVPGQDDDTTAHVETTLLDPRGPVEVFVEDVLYDGKVVPRAEWDAYIETHGSVPEGLPDDWSEVDPKPNEDPHGAWAFVHGDVIEIPGPPVVEEGGHA